MCYLGVAALEQPVHHPIDLIGTVKLSHSDRLKISEIFFEKILDICHTIGYTNTRSAREHRKNQITDGGIAQLGERLNGIQEVSGSIPLISTKKPGIKRFQAFSCRSIQKVNA